LVRRRLPGRKRDRVDALAQASVVGVYEDDESRASGFEHVERQWLHDRIAVSIGPDFPYTFPASRYGSAITVDGQGAVYITDHEHHRLSTTPDAPQTFYGSGSSDAIVSKVSFAASPPGPAGCRARGPVQDVGAVVVAGSAGHNAECLHGEDRAPDIWGAADAFQFVSSAARWQRPDRGGASTDLQNTSALPKPASCSASGTGASANPVILDVKPDGCVEFMARRAPAVPNDIHCGLHVEDDVVGAGARAVAEHDAGFGERARVLQIGDARHDLAVATERL